MTTSILGRRVVVALIFGCAAAFVLGLVAMIALGLQNSNAIRQTQLDGTPIGKRLLASSDRILDCTDPTGTCFRQSQQRTADAVGNINRVVVLASACAIGVPASLPVVDRQSRIQTCVIQRLAAERH